MECKYCKAADVVANGLTTAGTQRYLCRACGKSFTGTRMGRPRKINPDPRPHPAIGAAQRLADRFNGKQHIRENIITVTIEIENKP